MKLIIWIALACLAIIILLVLVGVILIRQNVYVNKDMSVEKLCSLTDAKLIMAVTGRIDIKCSIPTGDGLADLSETEITAYAIALYDMEVQNGGLLQYFANSSRHTAPYLSQALSAIEAPDMKKLFDSFITQNGIDINNLDEFNSLPYEEYMSKYNELKFEEYDKKFIELYVDENLEHLLAAYIRVHIDSFE